MNGIMHLISDITTIVLLLIISTGYMFFYLIRGKDENRKEELYFSVLIFVLTLFITVDNSIINSFFPNFMSIEINVTVVVFLCYFLLYSAVMFLLELVSIPRDRRKPFVLCFIILTVCPLLSILTIFKGPAWYGRYLGIPILLTYLLSALFMLVLIGYFIVKSRSINSMKTVFSFIGIMFLTLYISVFKSVLEFTDTTYITPKYLSILFPVLIFIFLTIKEKNDEYKELVELRSLNKDYINSPINLNSLNTNLSEKEQNIINGLCAGKLYKEISFEYGISLSYVKKLIHNIYKKCEVSNRAELINLIYNLKK